MGQEEKTTSELTQTTLLKDTDLIAASVDNGDGTFTSKKVEFKDIQALCSDAGNVVENIGFSEIKTNRDLEESPGSWRPIYTKTFDVGALPNNTSREDDHNIQDISIIIGAHGVATDSNGNMLNMPMYYESGSSIYLGARLTTIVLKTESNYSYYTGLVTLEYTKTTDTATSSPRYS